MPGLLLLTDLGREQAVAAAADSARELDLTVWHLSQRQFRARRGSLVMSWLWPPLTFYCNFLITVDEGDGSVTEVVLRRNNPWWTGAKRTQAVEQLFAKLTAATQAAITNSGAKLFHRREV
jgi:hypothetical protein